MSLPIIPLGTVTVNVGGTDVTVRALSRSEVIRLSQYQADPDAGEDFVLSCAAGVSLEAAREWRNSTPVLVVGELLDKVAEISGMVEGAQKSG